jgi:hypothetical protein
MWGNMNPGKRRNSKRLSGPQRTANKLTNNLDRQRRISLSSSPPFFPSFLLYLTLLFFVPLFLLSTFRCCGLGPFYFLSLFFRLVGRKAYCFSLFFSSYLPIRMTLGLKRQSIVFALSV